MKVTDHQADEDLGRILIGQSRETMRWMRTHKIRFIPMFGRQSFKIEGKHHFYGGVNIEAVGGGWGLVDMLVTACERMGIYHPLRNRPARTDPGPEGPRHRGARFRAGWL